jgi:glutamate dehydrogenase
LTRPELAVLLAYSKMSLDHELLASDLPDDPALAADLRDYFPTVLRERFAAEIAAHPLRREITATVATNDLVNRAGLTFVHDMRARTGRSSPDIARSYRIARDVFALPKLWAEIEGLDNKVPARIQVEILLDIVRVVEHAAAWLLRNRRLDLRREINRFEPGISRLAGLLPDLLPAGERALLDERSARFVSAGTPAEIAGRAAAIIFLTTAFEIGDLAERAQRPIDRAARIFYAAGARFALDAMREAARRLPAETAWQKQAVETVTDDLYAVQVEIAERVLQSSAEVADPLAAWAIDHAAALASAEAVTGELRGASAPDLAMLIVATRQLREALA